MRLSKDKSAVRNANHGSTGSPKMPEIDSATSTNRTTPAPSFDGMAKRAFDIIAATAGLCLLSPIFLLVSIAIKLDGRGPIFSSQIRYGYHNETIPVFMFRSIPMENLDGLTRIGHVLRRTGIDRLPMLINILRGEMSIVGPSLLVTAPNSLFEEPLMLRRKVKPGLTGWAQVSGFGGDCDTRRMMKRRLDADLYYIEYRSFHLDMKIILMTLLSKTTYVHTTHCGDERTERYTPSNSPRSTPADRF